MGLKIDTSSPDYPEIKQILLDFADHCSICDHCTTQTGPGKDCRDGWLIYNQLVRFAGGAITEYKDE